MSKKRGNQTVNEANPIRKDPDIMGLLSRLPQETASSLTDTQLQHIKVAVGSGQYRKHKVDLRGTIPLPFSAYRLYFVFLMGRNVRTLNRREKSLALFALLILTTLFLLLSALGGAVILYLVKSALGVNMLEGFSFGLWDWFNDTGD
jgi:hypothetical protein